MTSRPGITPRVYLNSQLAPAARVLAVHRSTGGKRLDTCEFVIDDLRPIEQFQIGSGTNAECLVVDSATGVDRIIHYGSISVTGVEIGHGDGRKYTSRLEPYHFGRPLYGMLEADPFGQAQPLPKPRAGRAPEAPIGRRKQPKPNPDLASHNPADVIFNPRVNGRVEPNRHPGKGQAGFSYFIDPDSTRTKRSREGRRVAATGPEPWNLVEAILYLCGNCNPDQTYIRNPTREELKAVPVSERADILQNFHITNGIYLPEALDKLLEPFCGGWYVEHLSASESVIRLFRRGLGNKRVAFLGSPGSTIDWQRNNLKRTEIDATASAAFNMIHAVGDYEYFESTYMLVPAWDEADDGVNIALLDKRSIEYNAAATVKYRRVWRDWVLNEAGDYEGWRSNWPPVRDARGHTPKQAYNFQFDFGYRVAPRRRRLLPTLTLSGELFDLPPGAGRPKKGDPIKVGLRGQPIGEIGGIEVEWSVNQGGTWALISELQGREHQPISILHDECGIRFEGMTPPDLFMQQGIGDIRIRVTATIRSDKRLEKMQASPGGSPINETHVAMLDVSDRYQKRGVAQASKYYTDVTTQKRVADVCDHTAQIEAFAKGLVTSWDMADASGSLVIEGLDGEQYQLGDLVWKIEGREIAFNCRDTNIEPRYPQIVSIVYDYQNQQRTLTVQTFRDRESVYG